MQNDPILRTGTPALVHPMELLVRGSLQFEIDVAREAAQRAVHGNPALGRQRVRQRGDPIRRQHRRRIEPDSGLPFFQ